MKVCFGIAYGQISSIYDRVICPPFCLIFRFWAITWVNINRLSPNLVCTLILYRSCLTLHMGKFHYLLTWLSAGDTSLFSFADDNLNKHQWIFTKCGLCIDTVEILFGIANGQILLLFWQLSVFLFQDNNLSKSQWIFSKLDMCIDIVEIWFAIAIGYISSIFYRVISPWHDNGRW